MTTGAGEGRRPSSATTPNRRHGTRPRCFVESIHRSLGGVERAPGPRGPEKSAVMHLETTWTQACSRVARDGRGQRLHVGHVRRPRPAGGAVSTTHRTCGGPRGLDGYWGRSSPRTGAADADARQGDFAGVPRTAPRAPRRGLGSAGRRRGRACRLRRGRHLRVPGRVHITWADDNTLIVEAERAPRRERSASRRRHPGGHGRSRRAALVPRGFGAKGKASSAPRHTDSSPLG